MSSIIAFKAGYNIYAYSSYLMGNKEIIHQSTPFDIPNDYHLIGIEHNNPLQKFVLVNYWNNSSIIVEYFADSIKANKIEKIDSAFFKMIANYYSYGLSGVLYQYELDCQIIDIYGEATQDYPYGFNYIYHYLIRGKGIVGKFNVDARKDVDFVLRNIRQMFLKGKNGQFKLVNAGKPCLNEFSIFKVIGKSLWDYCCF